MLTIRKIEKLWQEKLYRRLLRELMAGRPEASLELDTRLGGPTSAAAMTIVRLAELQQTHLPLFDQLRDRLLMTRRQTGGWGDGIDPDPATTALVVRALRSVEDALAAPSLAAAVGGAVFSADNAAGSDLRRCVRKACDAGLMYLAMTQSPDGSWAIGGEQRAFTTAFVVLQLGRSETFRQTVRLGEAMLALTAARADADEITRRLIDAAIGKTPQRRPAAHHPTAGQRRMFGSPRKVA